MESNSKPHVEATENQPGVDLSDEIKHSISLRFNDALERMNASRIDLAGMLEIIDETSREYPGTSRQQSFYAAMRELARKVSDASD